MLRQTRQLSGIYDDILDTINRNTSSGNRQSYTDILFDVGRQVIDAGRTAHIEFQNNAFNKIKSTIDEYDDLKESGQLDTLFIDAAILRIKAHVDDFGAIVGRINTAQARRGFSEIESLGARVIAGMQAERGKYGGYIGGTPGAILAGIDSGTLLLVGAVGVLLLLKRR